MQLAEALALRADTGRRIESLRARIVANARFQEGEPPDEDASALLVEVGVALDELESLIARINRTNAATRIEDGATVTEAIARRDVLRMRHSTVVAAADAAAGRGGNRQLRSELTYRAALPVPELRSTADGLAREIRELDGRIQRTNWEVELLD